MASPLSKSHSGFPEWTWRGDRSLYCRRVRQAR